MKDIFEVRLTSRAIKDLKRVPLHIATKLEDWIEDITDRGLSEIRKIPGYHDEPLVGKRMGQRSIRLNIAYRAIYTVNNADVIHFIEVKEVNKHAY